MRIFAANTGPPGVPRVVRAAFPMGATRRETRTMMRPILAACALALLAAPAVPGRALADAVPNLDIEKTCKSANQASVGLSDNANEQGCLRSERDARKEAEKSWGSYKPAAKAQCESQFKAGGYPSYVEMVTCLELASGAVPTQSGGAGGAPRGKGTGDLTREPAPSQRTDPIEVLEKR